MNQRIESRRVLLLPALKSLRSVILVVTTCSLFFLFGGYDLTIFGASVPVMLHEHHWGFSASQLGTLSGLVGVGMLVGTLGIGFFADSLGRKRALITCVFVFSSCIGLCGVMTTPLLFGLFYTIAGIGIGGMIPTATALTVEYAPVRWRTFTYAIMFTGYPLGGVLASLLSISLTPVIGWQSLFFLGALPVLLLAGPAAFLLPESVRFLLAKERTAEAEAIAHRFSLSLHEMTRPLHTTVARSSIPPTYLRSTVVFGCIAFCILFIIFGLSTWLPQLMTHNGYSLGSSLSFLLTLNLGCIAGTTLMGYLGDRFDTRSACGLVLLLGAGAIAALSLKLPLVAIYLLLIIVGNGTLGAQNLFNAYIAQYYPVEIRTTASGRVMGIGRLGGILGPLVGGYLQSAHLGGAPTFLIFAVCAALAAAIMLSLNQQPASQPIRDTPSDNTSMLPAFFGQERRNTWTN